MAKTTWSPNDTQKLFLKTLKGGAMTLHQASQSAGVEFKSGTTNTLTSKELVEATDKTFECELVEVETREVVGHSKKTVKCYSLTEKGLEFIGE